MGFEKIPGDRYEVVGRLGAGAFGSVCKAIDTFLNRPVAIKSIRLDMTLDGEQRKTLNRRFLREAQVAAQLHHPNIVTIYDIMFSSDTGFLVMEYIEGRTLQALLRKQRLSVGQAVDIALQVSAALQYAHEHKVVHRDVKPGNILMTSAGEARITDFGIAKSDGATHMTQSGGLVGTPDYMSPEQAKGEDVDARSDLFSLGCVLYECVVGEKPFKGRNLTGVLLSIVNTNPLESEAWRCGGFPHALGDVLSRLLEKDPGGRYPSALEVSEALHGIPVDVNEPRVEPETTASSVAEEEIVIDVESGTEHDRPLPRMTEEELDRLKQEERPLRFAASISDELQTQSLTPAQGFILSRIDGASRARDILSLSPLPELEAAETLSSLIELGLLTWEPGASNGAEEGERALDEWLSREVDQLLELGRKRRYSELLGVDVSTSTAEVKKSYLELVQRFHPDAQPPGLSRAARTRLSEVCTMATRALTALSNRLPKSNAAPRSARRDFDRSKHARDLFKRAQLAFDTTDYWQAIQLARQATELDDAQPEFFHLLGLGLMKNRNWMKEAEESLTKAVELDPNRAEYYGLLATVYKAEGMPERSASMLEKAKSLDPSYSLG